MSFTQEPTIEELFTITENTEIQILPESKRIIEEIIADEIYSNNEILGSLLNELSPINFYSKAGLSDGAKILRKHYLIISVEEVLAVAKTKNCSLCRINEQSYVFNGTYWVLIEDQALKSFLGKSAEKLGVDLFDAKFYGFKGDLFKQFLTSAYLPHPEKNANGVLINLKNGTFVITPDKQGLKEFDSKDFLRYQLDFEFDKNATAPLFKKYLNQVLPDITLQNILSEYLGYVFVPNKELKLEKAMILYGGGANGKSVFFEIVNALLGAENTCNYSLQSLTNETGYQRAKMADKLLNYASEISANMDSTIFKQLVSGEPVEARLPYGEPFLLTDYAKLIFNTNQLPLDSEQTDAFYRRFLIIPFNVTIPEGDRDTQLAKKIIVSELPGIFNWVLEGLQRLLHQKHFSNSSIVDGMLNAYKNQSDTIKLFFDEENFQQNNQNTIAFSVLYENYKSFCKEALLKTFSKPKFSKRLKEMGFTLSRINSGMVVDAIKKDFE